MAKSSLMSSMSVSLRADTRQFNEGMKNAKKNAASMASSVDKSTGGMSRAAKANLQNAGYQVQDFAIQVSGGTSAIVAFGQQGSQLLGMLGPAGAIAGTVVALGAAFYTMGGKAKKAANEDLEALIGKTEELTDAQVEYLKVIAATENLEMTKGIKVIADEIDELQSKLDLYESGAFGDMSADIKLIEDALVPLRSKLDSATQAQTDFNEKVAEAVHGEANIEKQKEMLDGSQESWARYGEGLVASSDALSMYLQLGPQVVEQFQYESDALGSLQEAYMQYGMAVSGSMDSGYKWMLEQQELRRKLREQEEKDAKASATAQLQNQATFVTGMQGLTSSLLATMDERSGGYKAMFIADRAFAVASAIVQAHLGANKALGLGPFGIPMSNIILGMGYANAGIIAGTAIGQFHGGTDSVPDSMNNKSFMLKAGERVVQPKANRDLTDFLANGSSGEVNVYNYGSDNVTAEQTENGVDIYVTKAELPDLMSGVASNPDSEFNQVQDRLYTRERA